MRALVITGTDVKYFQAVGGVDLSMPKLPQAYPYYGYLINNGIEVKILSLEDNIERQKCGKKNNSFWQCLKVLSLRQYISSFDVVISWGFIGAWLALVFSLFNIKSKVFTVVFANYSPNSNLAFGKIKNKLFFKGLKCCRGLIYMTHRQVVEAINDLKLLQEQIYYMPVGVDVNYFCPVSESNKVSFGSELLNLLKEPYILVSGDQLRDELSILNILKGTGFKLVRITQSKKTEEFWSDWKRQSCSKELDVFCKSHLSFEEVKFIYQHALCLLNLVDNSWQPAGWTVMTEAMACGIPVIMNKGLVTEELRFYQDPLPLFEVGSICDGDKVKEILKHLKSNPDLRKKIGYLGRKCVENNFSIDKMGKIFFDILHY